MNMTIDITEAISFDPEALEPINRLLAQLTDADRSRPTICAE